MRRNLLFLLGGSLIAILALSSSMTRIHEMSGDAFILKQYGEACTSMKNLEGRIAFVHWRDSRGQIILLSREGPREITPAGTTAWDPAFSPDGKSLVFAGCLPLRDAELSSVGEGEKRTGIFRTDLRSGSAKLLFSSPYLDAGDSGEYPLSTPVEYNHPRYSPEGSRVVFYMPDCDPDGSLLNIYLLDTRKDNLLRLTGDSGNNWGPSFSPGGESIIFTSDREFPPVPQIFIMDADGKNQRKLVSFPRAHNYDPSFSSDGKRIVFASRYDERSEIFCVDADGSSNLRKLTDHHPGILEEDVVNLNEWARDDRPCFSPAGDRIIFVSSLDNPYGDLYSTDLRGENRIRLTYGNLKGDKEEGHSHPFWGR